MVTLTPLPKLVSGGIVHGATGGGREKLERTRGNNSSDRNELEGRGDKPFRVNIAGNEYRGCDKLIRGQRGLSIKLKRQDARKAEDLGESPPDH